MNNISYLVDIFCVKLKMKQNVSNKDHVSLSPPPIPGVDRYLNANQGRWHRAQRFIRFQFDLFDILICFVVFLVQDLVGLYNETIMEFSVPIQSEAGPRVRTCYDPLLKKMCVKSNPI